MPDTTGKLVALGDFKDAPALLVVFMCNHCPFVKHIRAGLAQFARDYQPRGLAMVGINSNDVASYPEDSPAKMAEEVRRAGYVFPYLYDETQAVAKAYRAACTPDFFLYDRDRRLVYRGQFDDSRPEQRPPGHRRRPARRRRCGAAGQGGAGRAEAEHRLQHQVEATCGRRRFGGAAPAIGSATGIPAHMDRVWRDALTRTTFCDRVRVITTRRTNDDGSCRRQSRHRISR